MDSIHLIKIVYNELQTQYMHSESTAFNYIESIKYIVDERGVDYMLNGMERCNMFSQDINNLSSLTLLRTPTVFLLLQTPGRGIPSQFYIIDHRSIHLICMGSSNNYLWMCTIMYYV